ncbi:MAG: hypothetical protein DDT33_01276 [Firmicutes bacterium]|nr:hypothetical protein [Bacillota bacterium]
MNTSINESNIKKAQKDKPIFNHTESYIKKDILKIAKNNPGKFGARLLISEALRKGGDETTHRMVANVLLKMVRGKMIDHINGRFIPPRTQKPFE